jgi:hypothetical protein
MNEADEFHRTLNPIVKQEANLGHQTAAIASHVAAKCCD